MESPQLKTILKLMPDEKAAVLFFQTKNIIPQEKVCVNGHQMKLSFSDEKVEWQCFNQQCSTSNGIRENTWLEHTKTPLLQVAHFIYCWAKQWTSQKFCTERLNMSIPTIADLNEHLCEVCAWRIKKDDSMIGGEGLVVEIGEFFFFRQKNGASRVLSDHWIFGGICRKTKKCFLVQVSDRSAETLMPIIRQRIKPGSKIVSDQWQVYKNISMNDFEHKTVNDRLNFINPLALGHTLQIEQLWNSLEREYKQRQGTNWNYIDSYLIEFIWRTKLDGRDPFETILQDISSFNCKVNKHFEFHMR